jgi:NAD-dependent dihydropyrimidine dehydrogenase PreA subunit
MARYILPVLSSVLLAAHFSRVENDWAALVCLLFPLLLFFRKQWILKVYQLFLLAGGIVWVERTVYLVGLRQRNNMPWIRLAVILGVVALFTFFSAWMLGRRYFKERYKGDWIPQVSAFVLTTSLLTIVYLKVRFPILMMDRFWPGSAVVEIALLGFYAGFVLKAMMDPNKTSLVRARIWIVFSLVFFTQFFLGISGLSIFLMTGKIHLPVPALIAAGPLFRGSGFFMPILFTVTVLFVGAAWCSHLCYFGAWDNLAARRTTNPRPLPPWAKSLRVALLLLVAAVALGLRLLGVGGYFAAISAIVFGMVGVGIMIAISRRLGVMAHCVVYCPIGLLAGILGKVSPFRVTLGEECDGCGVCRRSCRYNALEPGDIQKRKPALSCTLCGDCLTSCSKGAIHYSFFDLDPAKARVVFLVLAVVLHAVFLGVARI